MSDNTAPQEPAVPEFKVPSPDVQALQQQLERERGVQRSLKMDMAKVAYEQTRNRKSQILTEIQSGDLDKGVREIDQFIDEQIALRDQALAATHNQYAQQNARQQLNGFISEIVKTFDLNEEEARQVSQVDPNTMPYVAQLLYKQRQMVAAQQGQAQQNAVQQRIASGADAVGGSAGPIGGEIAEGSRAHLAQLMGIPLE